MPESETATIHPAAEIDPQATCAVDAANEPASAVVRILDQYLADVQAGRAVDRAAVLAAHPDLAGQLEPCLAGIDFVQRAARTEDGPPARLGDFRILREV